MNMRDGAGLVSLECACERGEGVGMGWNGSGCQLHQQCKNCDCIVKSNDSNVYEGWC